MPFAPLQPVQFLSLSTALLLLPQPEADQYTAQYTGDELPWPPTVAQALVMCGLWKILSK